MYKRACLIQRTQNPKDKGLHLLAIGPLQLPADGSRPPLKGQVPPVDNKLTLHKNAVCIRMQKEPWHCSSSLEKPTNHAAETVWRAFGATLPYVQAKAFGPSLHNLAGRALSSSMVLSALPAEKASWHLLHYQQDRLKMLCFHQQSIKYSLNPKIL